MNINTDWLPLLCCPLTGLLGILTFFFPEHVTVYMYRLGILLNFLDRDNYVRGISERYGQEFVDDPYGTVKKWFHEFPERVILLRIMGVLFWIFFLVLLREIIRGVHL